MKKIVFIIMMVTMIPVVYSQEPSNTEKSTIHDIQKNSVYTGFHTLAFTGIYERTITLGNKSGLLVGGGAILGGWTGFRPIGKLGLIFGGSKHFFELGCLIEPSGESDFPILPLAGYRYQSKCGFFLRADLTVFLPGISVGYSF